MKRPELGGVRSLAWVPAAGAVAGLAVFSIDALLAWLTLGYPLPIRGYFVAWYVGMGAVFAAGLGLGCRLLRGRVQDTAALFAATAALLYAPAVAERLHNALAFRLGEILTGLLVAAAVAAYGGGLLGMHHLFGSPGLLVTAAAAAVGLALNRNVIPLPAEPRALVADALIAVTAVALAAAVRLSGRRRAAAALGALAAAAVLVAMLSPKSDPAITNDPPVRSALGSPNLILVIVDTLRADVFYSVLEETEEGEALRRALGGAVRFSNAIAAAPWTPPSVGSILTGLYPREHGLNRGESAGPSRPLNRLDESVTTLAEHLRQRGYRTAAIATNPFLQPEAGVAQGFHDFEILQDGTAKLPLLTAVLAAGLIPTELYQDAGRVRQRLDRRLAALARGEGPFFLWLHLMDPHQPLRSHPDLAADPAAAEIGREMQVYRDEVRYAARELARMIELVKGRGLWNDTALVLVSDHGEMMLSDRRFRGESARRYRRHGHGHALYRELVQVPLIIRPPGGLAADREVDVLTSHVDLAHTVADLLGVERMALPGERVSAAPWLGVEPPSSEPEVRSHVLVGATQAQTDQRALRTLGFKIIEYLDGDRPPELYDVKRDPRERKNLAPRGSRRLEHLREVLAESWSQLLPPPEARALEMDPETRQRLEALGYL